ncbi:myosin-9-like [Mya arenaria]|uniref:myosin-9-like n=1 Tax=Mya arenaria TaxID=6604 RepID=UPI0022E931F4|nr:myosin-9-like [Mya arenaria]
MLAHLTALFSQENRTMAVSKLEKSVLLEKDETLQLTAVRLYHSQREVARYLELGYLNLVDHPDIAKEVRLTAHDARAQHLMTSGLMKKFTMTSKHVVQTLLPMIRDGVELGDVDIVRETFGQILDHAEDMKTESEKTKASYYEIQGKVQANLGDVDKRNTTVKKTNEQKKIEREMEEKRQQQANENAEKLKVELAKADKELEELRSRRKVMGEEIEKDIKALDLEDGPTFIDDVMGSFTLGGVPETAKTIVNATVGLISGYLEDRRRQSQIKLKRKQYKLLNTEDRARNEQQVKLRIEEDTQRTEALERHAMIEKLNRDITVGLGDVHNLKEAATHLGDVDKLFTKIIRFWEDMAAATKYLKDDTKAGEVYLKKIEDERYQTRFLKSVERAEQNWGFFGKLCGAYVVETDREIDFLYEYLSKPLDHLSAEERKNRKQAVLSELKKEIDQVYPQIEDITDEKDA